LILEDLSDFFNDQSARRPAARRSGTPFVDMGSLPARDDRGQREGGPAAHRGPTN